MRTIRKDRLTRKERTWKAQDPVLASDSEADGMGDTDLNHKDLLYDAASEAEEAS